MNITITSDYEFLEVIRAFPILESTLIRDFHFDLNQATSEDTVATYFRKQALTSEEIRIVLRKMNHKLKVFYQSPRLRQRYEEKNVMYDKETLLEEE